MADLTKITQSIVSNFPSWMEMRKNPESIGAQFLEAFGLQLNDIDVYLNEMLNNQYVGTANLGDITIIHKALIGSGIRSSLTPSAIGDGKKVEYVQSIYDFYNTEDDVFIINYVKNTVYTRKYYEEFVVSAGDDNFLLTLSEHQLWNCFDEFGMLVGLERFNKESNEDFKNRIIGVFKKPGNSGKQGLKNHIGRKLGIAPDHVSMYEMHDKDFINGLLLPDGSASKKLKRYVDVINKKAPVVWEDAIWDKNYWNMLDKDMLGLQYLPRIWNMGSGGFEENDFQSGIGSGEDLKVFSPEKEDDEQEFNYYVTVAGQKEELSNKYIKHTFGYQVLAEGTVDEVAAIPTEAYVTLEAAEIVPVVYSIKAECDLVNTYRPIPGKDKATNTFTTTGIDWVDSNAITENKNHRYVKIRVDLKSENEIRPYLERIQLFWKNSSDTLLATECSTNGEWTQSGTSLNDVEAIDGNLQLSQNKQSGTWIYQIDLGVNFASLEYFDYLKNTPEHTSARVCISTSADNTTWSPWSRHFTEIISGAKVGILNAASATIRTPLITPKSANTSNNSHYSILGSNVNMFFASDSNEEIIQDAKVYYKIYKSDGTTLAYSGDIEATSSPSATTRYGEMTGEELERIADEGCFIEFSFSQGSEEMKHAFAYAGFSYNISYREELEYNNIANKISRNINNGKKLSLKISELGWTRPDEVIDSLNIYRLIDRTNRSKVAYPYYKSEEAIVNKTNVTNNFEEEVWVTSVGQLHLQKIHRTVYPVYSVTARISDIFTPRIMTDNSNDYSCKALNGWYNSNGDLVNGTYNEHINLSWVSGGIAGDSLVTLQLHRNGESTNDQIIIDSTLDTLIKDYVWRSPIQSYIGILNENELSSMEKITKRISLPEIPSHIHTGPNPFIIKIIKDSVTCNGKVVSSERINELTIDFETETILNEVVTRATGTLEDKVNLSRLVEILDVTNSLSTPNFYTEDIDFIRWENGIKWINPPSTGSNFYISYKRVKPGAIGTATLGCNYNEKIVENTHWQSSVVLKNWNGEDNGEKGKLIWNEDEFVSAELPDVNDITVWNDIPIDINPDTLTYLIYDDSKLVNTFLWSTYSNESTPIQRYHVKANLNSRRPQRHWNPQIRDGYYYFNKEERYLYSESKTIIIPDDYVIDDITKSIDIGVLPRKMSPIFISANDKVLKQVAFTNPITNEFQTNITEQLVCDGTSLFKLSYKNIDPGYTITLKSIKDNVTYYAIDEDSSDNFIKIARYSEDATPILEELSTEHCDTLKGYTFLVSYQPKDCYTVEYDSDNNSAKITFSEVYQNATIVIDDDRFNDRYLATEVDFNPIRTAYHSGFVHIVKEANVVENIYLTISPNEIYGNGKDRATITILCVDKYGNPVQNPDITVTATMGTLTEYIDSESPSITQMNGEKIFTYTSPIISEKTSCTIEVTSELIGRKGTITLFLEENF